MSFSLTTAQVRARAKTVTRRLGWLFLKAGERVMACEKVMGRKKGEPLVRICEIEIVSVRREPLNEITNADVILEGFDLDWQDFVTFFCASHKGCALETTITRIEFRYV